MQILRVRNRNYNSFVLLQCDAGLDLPPFMRLRSNELYTLEQFPY